VKTNEVKTNELITQCQQRHRSTEFSAVPGRGRCGRAPALDVHLIMDNCGTHKTPLIRNWLAKRPRFQRAPHPDQWIPAEPCGTLVRRTEQQLRGYVHLSVVQLKPAIREFITAHRVKETFVWTKSADRDSRHHCALRSTSIRLQPTANHSARTPTLVGAKMSISYYGAGRQLRSKGNSKTRSDHKCCSARDPALS